MSSKKVLFIKNYTRTPEKRPLIENTRGINLIDKGKNSASATVKWIGCKKIEFPKKGEPYPITRSRIKKPKKILPKNKTTNGSPIIKETSCTPSITFLYPLGKEKKVK